MSLESMRLARDPLEERDIQKVLACLDDERVIEKIALVLVNRVMVNISPDYLTKHGVNLQAVTFKSSEEKSDGKI